MMGTTFKPIQRQLGSGMWGGLHIRKRLLQCVAEHPYSFPNFLLTFHMVCTWGLRLGSWRVIRLSLIETISHLILNSFPNFQLTFHMFYLPDRSLSNKDNLCFDAFCAGIMNHQSHCCVVCKVLLTMMNITHMCLVPCGVDLEDKTSTLHLVVCWTTHQLVSEIRIE
jgi:hypothetical protein